MEQLLRRVSRFHIGVGLFAGLFAAYWIGPLAWAFQQATLLCCIPLIFVLTGILRRLVEWQLGKQMVPIKNDAILVTGCDSGFGQILATRLADKG